MNEITVGGRKLTLLNVVGPRASGVTSLTENLGRIYGKSAVIFDSSKVCDNHIELKTDIGKELMKYEGERSGGGFYPDELVYQAQQQKIQWLLESEPDSSIDIVIAAGAIRTKGQQETWEMHGGYKLLHGLIYPKSLTEVFEGVELRKADGTDRADSAPRAVLKSFRKFENHVLPLFESLPDDQKLCLPKSTSPIDRVIEFLYFLPVEMRDQAIRSFMADDHPVRVDGRLIMAKISHPPVFSEEVKSIIAEYEKEKQEASGSKVTSVEFTNELSNFGKAARL